MLKKLYLFTGNLFIEAPWVHVRAIYLTHFGREKICRSQKRSICLQTNKRGITQKQIKKYLIVLLILVYFYSLIQFFWRSFDNFTFKYNPNYYQSLYFSSQYSPLVERYSVVMQDEHLYAFSGYEYILGANPALINFEHPPLAKYLIGMSIKLTGNPNVFQLLVGILVLTLIYRLTLHFFKDKNLALVPPFLFSYEKLFRTQLVKSLLDIWQLLFVLIALLIILNIKRLKLWWLWLGIAIGGVASCKFAITALVFAFMLVVYFYLDDKKFFKKNIVKLLLVFIIAFIFYLSLFFQFFFLGNNLVDFFNLHIKILKLFKSYVPEYPWGEVWRMLFSGYWKTWWANKGLIKISEYNLFWPFLTMNLILTIVIWQKVRQSEILLLLLWSFIYLLFTSVHILFPHYLLLVLPFLYILLLWVLLQLKRYYVNRN